MRVLMTDRLFLFPLPCSNRWNFPAAMVSSKTQLSRHEDSVSFSSNLSPLFLFPNRSLVSSLQLSQPAVLLSSKLQLKLHFQLQQSLSWLKESDSLKESSTSLPVLREKTRLLLVRKSARTLRSRRYLSQVSEEAPWSRQGMLSCKNRKSKRDLVF